MAADLPMALPAAFASGYVATSNLWTSAQSMVQPPPETVIFLDIDGVLHSLHGEDLFRDTCCANLAYVVRATGASIVLSSSWRVDPEKIAVINSVLIQRGLAPIIDRTLELDTRQAEICEWLDRHPGVARWIAIDDLDLHSDPYWGGPPPTPYSLRLRGHFVRTDSEEGLTPQGAEMAVHMLLAQGRKQMVLQPAGLGKAPVAMAAPTPLRRRLASGMTSQATTGLVHPSQRSVRLQPWFGRKRSSPHLSSPLLHWSCLGRHPVAPCVMRQGPLQCPLLCAAVQ